MEPELLLVDDDPSALGVLHGILRPAGLRCSQCSDAHGALERIMANEDILVVLCDLYMPGLDGVQFTQRLSALQLGRPAPRVLLVTARPSLESAIAALRGGACDFLIKPLEEEQLLAAVDKALVQARRELLLHRSRSQDGADVLETTASRRVKYAALEAIEQLRRLRGRYDVHQLDDVAWELLLELLRTERGAHRLSVSGLTLSIPGVSATTSLRRISELTARGYVNRIPDTRDGRREFVALTGKAHELLSDYLENVDRCLTDIQGEAPPPAG